jgi:predicted O-methyltransferase YrrM
MDKRIEDVLEAYHQRIAAEHELPFDAASIDQRLLPVGPDTGRLINIIARSYSAPTILEIGTSYGYSGIWLAEAARATGGRLITLELQDYKSAYAREMSAKAGLADHVDFRVGDALELIAALEGKVDFVLLDLWKDLYTPCLELFYPKLNPGAVIVADNMTFPGGEEVARYGRAVRAKPGISSVLLPVGSGLEVSRYDPA